nr:hypothetical protein [Brucella pituitosa]
MVDNPEFTGWLESAHPQADGVTWKSWWGCSLSEQQCLVLRQWSGAPCRWWYDRQRLSMDSTSIMGED